MEVNFAFRQHYLMKLKTCHTFSAAVFFTLVLPLTSMAQDDRFGFDENSSKEVVKQDPESPSGTDNTPESRINKLPSASAAQETPVFVRDAEIKSKPAPKTVEKAPKEDEKLQKKEEEDPLSFNFLYYIIEKFKFSDIVE
ncbi:MAG TPA: hypothetical protein PK325_02325 [Cyclobacteriaceae bacterium]|nr:hypothetical protein [Cyclobacteriaceae bacterium]HMV07809.1 hypothetical protein [Cyclobacteriaceae bacterium]HMV88077.1 hypothetical protein [Cyclobacteriaceae bacterium]HMW98943.1 hypothetical protein [Cyclobacteriaceae bacterium]HMX48423.1 hypothetical protein [Cyclobacteriaceae bacterium]